MCLLSQLQLTSGIIHFIRVVLFYTCSTRFKRGQKHLSKVKKGLKKLRGGADFYRQQRGVVVVNCIQAAHAAKERK